VERLAANRTAERAVVERDRLGAAVERALRPDRGRERGPHPRDRLDRDDVEPRGEQRPRQLAGPGAEVEDARRRAGRGAEFRDDPVDDGRRVLGPPALVDRGDVGEAGDEGVAVGLAGHATSGAGSGRAYPAGMSALRLADDVAAWAELAAALVNTHPRATDPPEKLESVEDLERLLARCPEPSPPPTAADLNAVRALRAPLMRVFEADTLDELADAANPLLERGTAGWAMAPQPDGRWALGPGGDPDLAAWLGAGAARGLAELAISYGIERLHLCAADDCLCAVVDVSRNGARRYCSRTCANRTNVRRHRLTH
jgi:predicted RNA-binding Zn ribbon-like protein